MQKKLIKKIKNYISIKKQNIEKDQRAKNRFIVVVITSLLLVNYLMICYHVDKNPFDILPSWPVTDSRDEVTVYLPNLDGKTIFSEKRLINKNMNLELYIRSLVKNVIASSEFDNTKEAVPIEGNIRKVWIHNKICVIDFYLEENKKNITFKDGREANFKKALKKTILENAPEIKDIIVLSKGIPGKNIWETAKN